MDEVKQFIFNRFELLLVFFLVLTAEVINFYLQTRVSLLNLYYLPVLLAGYYLGKRYAVVAGIASASLITLFVLLKPVYSGQGLLDLGLVTDVAVWGFFLVATGWMVGTLYEEKESKVDQLKSAYVGILEILSKYLESYDRYTMGHSIRVSKLSTEVAIGMDLSRSEVENVRVAGLLHDIGKVDVSLDIIQKSAELTDRERSTIDRHAGKGGEILSLVGTVLQEAIPLVRAHHTAYMDGIDKSIPVGARIIAVVDAYDAIVTDRPYRAGKTPWQAIGELESGAGSTFDPEVVKALRTVIAKIEDPQLEVSKA